MLGSKLLSRLVTKITGTEAVIHPLFIPIGILAGVSYILLIPTTYDPWGYIPMIIALVLIFLILTQLVDFKV